MKIARIESIMLGLRWMIRWRRR